MLKIEQYKGAVAGAVFAVLMACAGQARAQDDSAVENRSIMRMGRPFYVSPMASYTFADKDREVNDGFGGTLAVGTRVYDFLALEASAHYTKLDNQQDGFEDTSAKLSGYGVTALMFPLKNFMRNLYAVIGVQYSNAKGQNVIADGNPTRASFDGIGFDEGLGYLQSFNVFGLEAAARLQAVYRIDTHDKIESPYGQRSFGDVIVSAGLAFALFSPKPASETPLPETIAADAAVVPISDTDGDGVADDADRCPDTPAGTSVDALGCPPVAPAAACGNTDGAARMDMSACTTGDVIVLHGVNFDTNKATLTANAKTILDTVVEALKGSPTIKIEISGHTDSRGSDDYNLKLSQRRADSVKSYLADHGVDMSRLTSVGYGEAHPVGDNETEAGQEQNRRVELKIEG